MKHQLTLSEYKDLEKRIDAIIRDFEEREVEVPTTLTEAYYNIVSKRQDLEQKLSVLT